ncbi:MAG TPA: hypothetical protein VFT02_09590 [Pyrinomonadaceae bacterium]|nr:hypothetical protein [Pyrinomonadaceae bacterium]
MISSQTQLTFRKTATCPASSTLLSYRAARLSRKAAETVRLHLHDCEFCNAELPLLAHHKTARGTRVRTPEIPINLRILAESIFLDRINKISKSTQTDPVNSEILSKLS